jgi:hypothetical protein
VDDVRLELGDLVLPYGLYEPCGAKDHARRTAISLQKGKLEVVRRKMVYTKACRQTVHVEWRFVVGRNDDDLRLVVGEFNAFLDALQVVSGYGCERVCLDGR